jgi:hypothetical protein
MKLGRFKGSEKSLTTASNQYTIFILGESAGRTLSNLVQLNPKPEWLDYVMRIISIPILGLLFISL